MSYSSEVYQKARAFLEDNRRRAEHNAAVKKADIYKHIPELQDLEKSLFQTMARLSLTALENGENSEKILNEIRNDNENLQKNRKEYLLQNGYPEDALEPEYSCSICEDTGWIDGNRCSCYEEACRRFAREELEKSSGAAKCSFDNFDLELYPAEPEEHGLIPKNKMTANFRFCREYAQKFSLASPSLLLVGRTGLGKTHLSLSIAKEVLEKGYGVVYQTAQRLVNDLERAHFSPLGTDADRKKYAECDLLIIDDLGAEFSNSFSVSAIGNLINERLFENRPTIISTNLTAGELTARYTERTGSRLLGEYKMLYFLGNDLRTR